MTPERRAEIDAILDRNQNLDYDPTEYWLSAHFVKYYHYKEAALDLRAECDRLTVELERSVSDHEACIEIIHKSDDQMERFLKVINDMRTSHGRHPSVPPTHCFICAVLNAFAALDTREPTT